MQVSIGHNRHPDRFSRLIPAASLDLYHQPDVLSLIYPRWLSVLVSHGDQALAGCFEPRPIGDSGLSDVEPAMGYSGLVVNSADPGFIAEALAAYSAACRSERVVAELIRFNPVLADHRPFEDQAAIEVVPAKQVVVCRCSTDPAEVLAGFSSSRRKLVTRTRDRLSARLLEPSEIDQFRGLYEQAMTRLQAESRWLFDDAFYAGLVRNPRFGVVGVWKSDRLLAACVIGCAAPIAHYVIAANSEDYAEGAGERLIFEAALESARRGADHLILGGGVTGAPDDGLLVFKKRFSPAAAQFYIGKMVHDTEAYERLCAAAVQAHPDRAGSRQLLRYRPL